MSLPSPLTLLLPPALMALCETVSYPADAALFLTGDKPRWMFYVCTGEVVLERHGLNGQAACLQRCPSGWVGEASLTSERYHCDGRTTETTQVARIPIQTLREALRHDSGFAERWIHMLSREVRRLRLQNERLSLPKVQDRLLHLIDTEGEAGCYPLTCSLKLLARQLAVTHEALYRALSELERARRIDRSASALCLVST